MMYKKENNKWLLISKLLREMQIKSAVKLFLTYQFGKNKEFDNILCVQDERQQALLHMVVKSVNWYYLSGRQFGSIF